MRAWALAPPWVCYCSSKQAWRAWLGEWPSEASWRGWPPCRAKGGARMRVREPTPRRGADSSARLLRNEGVTTETLWLRGCCGL